MSYQLNMALDGAYTNGTNISGKIVPGTLEFERVANGRSYVRFNLKGNYGDDEIRLTIPGKSMSLERPAATDVFIGIVNDVSRVKLVSNTADKKAEIHVECVDLSDRLDRRAVFDRWADTDVGDGTNGITKDLLDDYLAAEDISWGTITDPPDTTSIDLIEPNGRTVRWVLDQIAEKTGTAWVMQADRTIDIVTRGNGGTASAINTNLILNNSFETAGPANWTTAGTPPVNAIVTDEVWDGINAHRLTCVAGGDGRYQDIASPGINDGSTHRLSAWVRCVSTGGGNTGARIEVEDQSGGGGSVITASRVLATANSTYSYITADFIPPNDNVRIFFGGIGAMRWDDIQLYDISSPFIVNKDSISVRGHREGYRNKQHILYNELTPSLEEIFEGDGTTESWTLKYPVGSFTGVDVNINGAGYLPHSHEPKGTERVIDFGDHTGAEFADQPAGTKTVKIKSSNAGDMNLDAARVIGTESGTSPLNVITEILTTNAGLGTNWGTVSANSFDQILGVYVGAADPDAELDSPAGTITVGTSAGLTIVDGLGDGDDGGVVLADAIGVDPPRHDTIHAAADDASTKIVGLKDVDGNYFGATLSGTTQVNFVDDVLGVSHIDAGGFPIYVGHLEAARTVTVYSHPEFTFGIASHTIGQHIGHTLYTAADLLKITYQGMFSARTSQTEASQVTARDGDEGGSGLYEHVATPQQPITNADANTLANGLLDLFAEDDALSQTYFPRKELIYRTFISGVDPGETQVVNLPAWQLQNESMLVTRVIMRDFSRIDTASHEFEYEVHSVNTKSIGNWENFFRAITTEREYQTFQSRFFSDLNIVDST